MATGLKTANFQFKLQASLATTTHTMRVLGRKTDKRDRKMLMDNQSLMLESSKISTRRCGKLRERQQIRNSSLNLRWPTSSKTTH